MIKLSEKDLGRFLAADGMAMACELEILRARLAIAETEKQKAIASAERAEVIAELRKRYAIPEGDIAIDPKTGDVTLGGRPAIAVKTNGQVKEAVRS